MYIGLIIRKSFCTRDKKKLLSHANFVFLVLSRKMHHALACFWPSNLDRYIFSIHSTQYLASAWCIFCDRLMKWIFVRNRSVSHAYVQLMSGSVVCDVIYNTWLSPLFISSDCLGVFDCVSKVLISSASANVGDYQCRSSVCFAMW